MGQKLWLVLRSKFDWKEKGTIWSGASNRLYMWRFSGESRLSVGSLASHSDSAWNQGDSNLSAHTGPDVSKDAVFRQLEGCEQGRCHQSVGTTYPPEPLCDWHLGEQIKRPGKRGVLQPEWEWLPSTVDRDCWFTFIKDDGSWACRTSRGGQVAHPNAWWEATQNQNIGKERFLLPLSSLMRVCLSLWKKREYFFCLCFISVSSIMM